MSCRHYSPVLVEISVNGQLGLVQVLQGTGVWRSNKRLLVVCFYNHEMFYFLFAEFEHAYTKGLILR